MMTVSLYPLTQSVHKDSPLSCLDLSGIFIYINTIYSFL